MSDRIKTWAPHTLGTMILAVLGWFAINSYQAVVDEIKAQRIVDAQQNASLASTAEILRALQNQVTRQESAMLREIDRLEDRLAKVEEE